MTDGEREARWGHRGGVLELTGSAESIDAVERSLFTVGAVAIRLDADEPAFRQHPQLLAAATSALAQSGSIALVARAGDEVTLTARAGEVEVALPAGDGMHAVAEVHRLLRRAGIFISTEGANL